MTVPLRFMGNLPHVLLIWETFKKIRSQRKQKKQLVAQVLVKESGQKEEKQRKPKSFSMKSLHEGSQLHFTSHLSVCADRNEQKLCLLSVYSRMRINISSER